MLLFDYGMPYSRSGVANLNVALVAWTFPFFYFSALKLLPGLPFMKHRLLSSYVLPLSIFILSFHKILASIIITQGAWVIVISQKLVKWFVLNSFRLLSNVFQESLLFFSSWIKLTIRILLDTSKIWQTLFTSVKTKTLGPLLYPLLFTVYVTGSALVT